MILQARTPRSLSWAGCLVVAGLGLFLLPLVPVQAQSPPQDVIAQAGPAEKESVDQQIETLKKAIMILEKQKQAEKAAKPEGKKVDPAELDKAKHDVAEVAKMLEVKRAELRALEAKFQQAQARLAALQGGKALYDNNKPLYYKYKTDEKLRNFTPVEVQMEALKAIAVDGKMLQPVQVEALKALGVDPKVPLDALKVWGTSKDKKPAESLEQKLDRLMKEIEELRQEIRKDKPSPYFPRQ